MTLAATPARADAAEPQTVRAFGLFRGESFASRSRISRGRTSGFDYLRILLALAVIFVHSAVTCYGGAAGDAIWTGYWRPVVACILPAFFALSGFLVTGSLTRSKSLLEFGLLRALRLMPALFVEVLIAAFILGPLMTRLPLASYFSDPKFFAYGLNVFGDIHFQLPGLFLDNPDPDMVNRQLWTIPSELKCYLALAVLAVIGLASRWRFMAFLMIAAVLVFPFWDLVVKNANLFGVDNVPPKVLILFFLAGVTFNLMQEKTPLSWGLFVVCAALSYVCLYVRPLSYFASLPLSYVTLFIGLSRPPRSLLTATGDYSYGVYLYGYPIQQTFAHLFPQHRNWILNILFTVPISLVFAWMSWTFVESKVLAHRVKIIARFTAALHPVTMPLSQMVGGARARLRRRWPVTTPGEG